MERNHVLRSLFDVADIWYTVSIAYFRRFELILLCACTTKYVLFPFHHSSARTKYDLCRECGHVTVCRVQGSDPTEYALFLQALFVRVTKPNIGYNRSDSLTSIQPPTMQI